MRYILAVAALLALAPQLVSAATTVTLTNSCSSNIINQSNSYLLLNISNSGNGPANDFLLIPTFYGAATPNSTVSIPLITPGSVSTTRFYLSNFSLPGSYAEYITAKYSQGSSNFITIFACLANIQKNAQSLVQILGVNITGTKVGVSLFNLAKYPISVNVSLHAPPTFGVQPRQLSATLYPNSQATEAFNVTEPSYSGASFPIVASASYVNSSTHYATISVRAINFAASGPGGGGLSATTIGTIAAVAALAALIAFSLLRRRKGGKRRAMPEAPAPTYPATS